MARNLNKEIAEPHVQQLFAFQYKDGTDEFTIRKSFEKYLDINPAMQAEVVNMFLVEDDIEITFPELRKLVFDNCDVDKVHKPEPLF